MSHLYQQPDAAPLDFKTELQRMAERMERGALELRESADKWDERATSARESAAVMEAKAVEYRRLYEAEPAPLSDYDDLPF